MNNPIFIIAVIVVLCFWGCTFVDQIDNAHVGDALGLSEPILVFAKLIVGIDMLRRQKLSDAGKKLSYHRSLVL